VSRSPHNSQRPNASTYPKPDRSGMTPNFTKSADNDAIEIGWAEGVLSDGRPYRAECWAQDQVTSLTFFVSAQSLESATAESLADMLEREGLVRFVSNQHFVAVRTFIDSAGNQLLSINIVIGDDEQKFADSELPLTPYRH